MLIQFIITVSWYRMGIAMVTKVELNQFHNLTKSLNNLHMGRQVSIEYFF